MNRRTEFVIVNDNDRFASSAASLEQVKVDKNVNLTYVETGANERNQVGKEASVNEVTPINTGATANLSSASNFIKIAPIYFEFDKWSISNAELQQLDRVVQIMKDNPAIIVEAGAHTDSKNREAYNQILSDKRG